MFRTLSLSFVALTLSLTAACGGKDGPSCAQVVDHVGKLSGMQLDDAQRKAGIAKCEKEPASRRTCALKATNIEQLMACK